jgi:hypothetical protein
VLREAKPSHATEIKRFEGLVALCDFVDPWGNTFGFYQVLFEGTEPPTLTGSNRDHLTDVEKQIAKVGFVQNWEIPALLSRVRGRSREVINCQVWAC